MVSRNFFCSNWAPNSTGCKNMGKYCCKNCQLVTYCNKSCQETHWPTHKVECKSPLGKDTWRPAWILENRVPAFIGASLGAVFGKKKYLWGNIPAIDLLKLDENEGNEYSGDLRILCAASGDLRHTVKTIVRLPSSYQGRIEMTLNDRDFDIVARNVILLLIAMVVEDIDAASDCIIHLWYSALIRQTDLKILQQQVRPLIQDVCEKIENEVSDSLCGKTWTFGKLSLRVVFDKSSWNGLLSFFDVPPGLDIHQAHQCRVNITLADSRKDYRDRYMCLIPPSHRVAFNKFREDGLLLPFGFPRHEFEVPNPTFFQDTRTWPMPDNADPRHGWSADEIANAPCGAGKADIYGKLHSYLRNMVSSFLIRLHGLEKGSFKLFQVDATLLPGFVNSESFSRIEVSNISDYGWLGIHHTLSHMIPLLQNPTQNPHATLITLFMNAVEETMTDKDRIQDMNPSSTSSRRLLRYLPPQGGRISEYDPRLIKFSMGRDLVTNYDFAFDRYCDELDFYNAGRALGTVMKEKHTIIEKWPFRLKLQPGKIGAQEEFDQYLCCGISSKERYVEWAKTG